MTPTDSDTAARTGQAAIINERTVRAYLNECANQVLLRNAHLICAEIQLSGGAMLGDNFAVCIRAKTGFGDEVWAFGPTLNAAEGDLHKRLKTAPELAAAKRAEAEKLLAEVARIEAASAA